MAGKFELGLAFWNCKLAHPGNQDDDLDLEEIERVTEVISSLIKRGVHVIGLCEVYENHMKIINTKLRARGLAWKVRVCDEEESAGKSRWDLAIMYSDAAVKSLGRRTMIRSRSGQQIGKAAVRYPLHLNYDNTTIHLYLAHWPSHNPEENEHKRKECSREAWDNIRSHISSEPESLVVLMGDLNDEPFSQTLSALLRATRDPKQARLRGIMYNPFWGHMSSERIDESAAYGTVLYNGDLTRWKTFDHIMLSPGFLRAEGLHLERAIRYEEEYRVAVGQGAGFDHLPIGVLITGGKER